MINPKQYISDIIKEGIKSAQKLKDEILKEKITLLFEQLWDCIDDVNKLSRVLDLSRKLSISIMEALDFYDYEELEEVVVSVYKEIEKMD